MTDEEMKAWRAWRKNVRPELGGERQEASAMTASPVKESTIEASGFSKAAASMRHFRSSILACFRRFAAGARRL
jgi:hypothetical protein